MCEEISDLTTTSGASNSGKPSSSAQISTKRAHPAKDLECAGYPAVQFKFLSSTKTAYMELVKNTN
jgi:hypothetical protein